MKPSHRHAWPIAAAITSAVMCTAAPAQVTDDIAGTWSLVSSVTERDGQKYDQFGAGAQGMMVLDRAGHFMLTIIGADLPKFTSNNRAAGTAEENRAVVGKSIAMFGSYALQRADRSLTLHIDHATFPNWDATDQRRSVVTLTADELKYVTAQASGGGTATVTWHRVR